MRKFMLAAGLCVVASVLVPVASASALTGSCKIAGEAEFGGKKLPFVEPAKLPFNFTAKAGNNFEGLETSGCKNEKGEAVELEAASVEGKGELACVVSNGLIAIAPGSEVHGKGSIKVEGKAKAFDFKFVAAGGAVHFKVEEVEGDGVKGAGSAEFLSPGTEKQKKELAEKCAAGTLESLKFAAIAAGKF